MSKEERQEFDNYIDAIMTQNDVLDTAKMEGHAEGHAEGLAEGRAEEKLANARNFKALGVSTKVIMQATGLTVEEIEKL